jgi:hypothetical protein
MNGHLAAQDAFTNWAPGLIIPLFMEFELFLAENKNTTTKTRNLFWEFFSYFRDNSAFLVLACPS